VCGASVEGRLVARLEQGMRDSLGDLTDLSPAAG